MIFETVHKSKAAKHQPPCNAHLCVNAATVIFKGNPRNSNTWLNLECDICLASLCHECATIVDELAYCDDCQPSKDTP